MAEKYCLNCKFPQYVTIYEIAEQQRLFSKDGKSGESEYIDNLIYEMILCHFSGMFRNDWEMKFCSKAQSTLSPSILKPLLNLSMNVQLVFIM